MSNPMTAAEIEVLVVDESKKSFASGLHGYAAFCEASQRAGTCDAQDLEMMAAKFRDAAFVIEELEKLRDGKLAIGFRMVSGEELRAAEAERDRLAAEVERLQKIIAGCGWYWPEDDTSSDACSDGPWDIYSNWGPGEICAIVRGGVVETRYYAWLPPADDSDSDDQFLVDEVTEDAAAEKVSAEIARRASSLATTKEGRS